MSKSIIIVGAGSGIGQAVAERFGREGWSVVLIARNADRLSAIVAELETQGIRAFALPADASRPEAIRAALAEAERLTGKLTVVHFNAAVVRQQDLFSMSDDEVVSDLAINVAAGLHTIRAAVERFGDAGGTILVTGGGLALAPHADYASLGLGKAALRNVVEGLAAPLASRGTRIRLATVATLVDPGSKEAADVADILWAKSADPAEPWETIYPSAVSNAEAGDRLTVVARLTAKPDQAEALGEALRGLVEPTLAEAGSIEYRLHRDIDDPNIWILYETWRSRADLDAHFAQPYTKTVLDRFPELLARDAELTFHTPIPPRS
ncbi:SDR family NAD(P)-dependent oxidoreductase [Skermanella stibiiresistens]|uniref:SDR family NAD(P)-dependent oxidoreductase n=1 Tax=Skermanella stibiiresistens TaxID=913326 RepID=UPI0004AEECF4|nr:SDR family NAD(P)-dependent oxidoreductase [Skermanella stibiiresistens]